MPQLAGPSRWDYMSISRAAPPLGCSARPGLDTVHSFRPAAQNILHRAALTLLSPSPDPEPLLDRQQWSSLPCACLRGPLRDGALLHVPPCSPPCGWRRLRVPWGLRARQPRGTDSHGRPLRHSRDEPQPQWLRAEQRAGPQDLQHCCPEDESKGAQRRDLLGDMTGLQPMPARHRESTWGQPSKSIRLDSRQQLPPRGSECSTFSYPRHIKYIC